MEMPDAAAAAAGRPRADKQAMCAEPSAGGGANGYLRASSRRPAWPGKPAQVVSRHSAVAASELSHRQLEVQVYLAMGGLTSDSMPLARDK